MTKEEFKIIYDLYFDNIRMYIYYRSGNGELATDIAQEVFIKVWEKQFDYHPNKIKSLLYKIALDIYISHYRKVKVETKYLNEIKFNFTEGVSTNSLEYQELKTLYEKTLANLPEKQREVFLMSRLEELTYKEIAERLEIGVKAVEKRMSLALGVLKKAIKV
ncbi:MAG: sigma-70 family RNA polymerase sigma factor [Vicingaceae bacterium]